ncbi:hypothetical protein HNQ56_004846 [Anaerotaenia torta]|uniref:hypothetical protein n=1 Tax=Anaerotaenia torta TaxID=433293 RepID=UPI003D202454
MQELKIHLCQLIGHGDVDTEYDNQTLRFITGKQNTRFWTTETPVISFLEVPEYFKLPVTIDLVIRIDSPAFYLPFGKGHGFSYVTHIYENVMDHFFWWYMVSNYKYENKYMGRKNDLTAQTFSDLHRMFHAIEEVIC